MNLTYDQAIEVWAQLRRQADERKQQILAAAARQRLKDARLAAAELLLATRRRELALRESAFRAFLGADFAGTPSWAVRDELTRARRLYALGDRRVHDLRIEARRV
jgi:hypothetical protein